jgi:DNA-binding transcriptional LysR family regulator
MNHYDMTDFRLFIQIAESNSLRKGADLAHLSAPAASARIGNIEGRIGTKLLMRSSKGMTLTPAGQAFLHHAKLITSQVEDLKGDLEAYANNAKGHLRIAANPAAVSEVLPRVLRSFVSTHPKVLLDLREMYSSEIVRWVTSGNSDIGIVLGKIRSESLEVLSYWETKIVLVTALDHPLAGLTTVLLAEALQYNFVDFPERSPIYWPLHNAAETLGIPVRTQVRVGSHESFFRLIEAGIGIGVVPEPSARRAAKSMSVAVIPIDDENSILTGSLCARRFKALPSFARDFVTLLMNDWNETGAEPE